MDWVYWFRTYKTELSAGVVERRLIDYHNLTHENKMTTKVFRTKKGNYGIKFVWN
ncbi:hypothetical protein D3C81_544270 [compost metagenome]